MMKDIGHLLQLLLEGFASYESADERVLKEEKKSLSKTIGRFLEGNVPDFEWSEFLSIKRSTELGNLIIEFCKATDEESDLMSLRKLNHFLKIEASSDEILEEIEKMIKQGGLRNRDKRDS